MFYVLCLYNIPNKLKCLVCLFIQKTYLTKNCFVCKCIHHAELIYYYIWCYEYAVLKSQKFENCGSTTT